MMHDFNRINYKQINILLNTVLFNTTKDVHFIESLYNEKAINFTQTINFMVDIGLLKINNGSIAICKKHTFLINKGNTVITDEVIKRILIKSIMSSTTIDKKQINEYLSLFILRDSKYVVLPLLKDRLKYSGIRDFLFELGVIQKTEITDEYCLDNRYLHLFVLWKGNNNCLTPAEYSYIQKYKEKIGELAEIAILNYEVNNLKSIIKDTSLIKRISEFNISAGYDIESIDKDSAIRGEMNKIFIEVKTFQEECKFYWSSNERDVAKIHGNRYYIYLLPRTDNDNFDFDNLQIIQNPYKNIDSNEWFIKQETLSYTKINGKD